MATMSPASAFSTGSRFEPAEGQQLGQPRLFEHLAVAGQRLHRHRWASPARPGCDAAGQKAAQIGDRLQRRRQHAERAVGVDLPAAAHGDDAARTAASDPGARRLPGVGGRPALLGRGERIGKSSCSSSASSAANRSKTSSTTQSGRAASGLSTLLTTTIGRRPSASAFMVTNLVCGIGPSAASTSSTTPSTMERMRSTSPPKSAWPGTCRRCLALRSRRKTSPNWSLRTLPI